MGTSRQITKLRVRQQNVNKSLTATSEILAKCSPDHYDILAIQEPHIDFLGNTRAVVIIRGGRWRETKAGTELGALSAETDGTRVLANSSCNTKQSCSAAERAETDGFVVTTELATYTYGCICECSVRGLRSGN
ncbi:hypothetical protein JB92DRAFT_462007 [Gautieria morchelliformis]|nr:hypothetical protein JB92DRAFT_462007 [Gautieria morchelliformis]